MIATKNRNFRTWW